MRAAPDCRSPLTVRHALQPRTSTSRPPQQQDSDHNELHPCTGKGASAGAGPPRSATRQAAGLTRGPPPPPSAPQPKPHTTRPPANNNRMDSEEGLMSCQLLSSNHPVVVGAGDVSWGSLLRGGQKRRHAPGVVMPSACGVSAV